MQLVSLEGVAAGAWRWHTGAAQAQGPSTAEEPGAQVGALPQIPAFAAELK